MPASATTASRCERKIILKKYEKNTLFCEFLAQLDDGRVLVVGGEGPDDQVVTAIEFYDADADEWTVSEVML